MPDLCDVIAVSISPDGQGSELLEPKQFVGSDVMSSWDCLSRTAVELKWWKGR